jgi:hypothetical protein
MIVQSKVSMWPAGRYFLLLSFLPFLFIVIQITCYYHGLLIHIYALRCN